MLLGADVFVRFNNYYFYKNTFSDLEFLLLSDSPYNSTLNLWYRGSWVRAPSFTPFLKSLFTVVKGLFLCPQGRFLIKNKIRQAKADALCFTRKTAQLDENVLQMFYNGIRQYGYNQGSGSQTPQKRGWYL
jgi:hypothetical protein